MEDNKIVSLVPKTGPKTFDPMQAEFIAVIDQLRQLATEGKVLALGLCFCHLNDDGTTTRQNLVHCEDGYVVQLVGLTAILHGRALRREESLPKITESKE